MAQCKSCGGELREGAKFCHACGYPAETATPEESESGVGAPQATLVHGTPQGAMETSFPYGIGSAVGAGFWRRAFAYCFDLATLTVIYVVLVLVIVLPASLLSSAVGDDTAATLIVIAGAGLAFIAFIVTYLLYIIVPTGRGATLGKRMLGMRVVRQDNGEAPGFGKALLREVIGKFVSAVVFYLGYIWIAFEQRKLGWHDMIAGTRVVKR